MHGSGCPQSAYRPMTIFWRYFHTSFFTSRRDKVLPHNILYLSMRRPQYIGSVSHVTKRFWNSVFPRILSMKTKIFFHKNWLKIIKKDSRGCTTHPLLMGLRRGVGGRLKCLKKNSPGRMAETPRAGMGDFTCRSWRYQCSIVLMRKGNLFKTNTFLISSLPSPDNRG